MGKRTRNTGGTPGETVRTGWPLAAALLLAACGGSGGGSGGGAADGPGSTPPSGGDDVAPRLTRICNDEDFSAKAANAFFSAREGDVIEFCAGRFDFDSGLVLANTRDVTIRGAGMEETVLSFAGSNSKEGIFATNVEGLTVEDLTVMDTPGDGVKVSDSRFITIRRVRATWSNAEPESPNFDPSQESWAANGAYAIYTVLTEDVIIEDSVSRGSSDVGFYIGQSDRVIVRNNLADSNVQGYEFENTRNSEMHGNLATANAGGFLVVDLPNRQIYGGKNRLFDNRIIDNNIDNFAPRGTIAAAVPRGTGMIILASDQVEVFNNEIRGNDTLGMAIVHFGLVDSTRDPRLDFFNEGLHIHDNVFADNGGNPQLPQVELTELLADPAALLDNPSLLPLLIMAKNGGQTAHIAWDGINDSINPDCPRPEGVPTDERGRPMYGPDDEAPDCGADDNGNPVRYNAWKFDADGELIRPDNWICIDNNVFENNGLPVPEFVNFNGTELALASRDATPHRCALPALPPTQVRSFTPGTGEDDAPSDAEVAAACGGGRPGEVNRDAVAFDCPRLADYGLFEDPQDPRSGAIDGIAYDLTTELFSDHATKYRFVFLPPGEPARWRDLNDAPNAHLDFPVGTVIAKTFAFRDGEAEEVVETRLLIKRQGPAGPVWQGLPYIWREADGRRIAELKVEGGTAAVSWDFEEPRSGERITGSTHAYLIPQAAQCVACHQQEDGEPGSAPIGPKPRLLNRDFDYGPEIGVRNQLAFLCSSGLLVDCPDDLSTVERTPEWNLPGSAGFAAGSDEDIEARARAYLEVNCAHCHNPRGNARGTRMFLERFLKRETGVTPRPVNRDYGICKQPVASGRGTGDRRFDIVPGDPDASILDFRLFEADDVAIRMPPIARSVRHENGYALVREWISRLPLPTTEDDTCSGPLSGLALPGLALP